ncbi:MAG: hypothetical protein AB1635_18320 [Acidobacteriota bacterium]
MPSIVIVGAGEMAGALARQLAAADLAPNVVLVDEAAGVAAGKALDILQASAVDRYATRLSGVADVSVAAGASLVIIADTAAGAEWQDDAGLQLVKRLAGLNQTAPFFCAGARQASLIERAVGELGLPRRRLVGTAPEALRAAVTAVAALEAGCAPADVMLSVLGRPPHQVIVPWDEASIAGRAAIDVLDPPAIARIEARLPRLWPPAAFTLASAAVRVARSALSRSPRSHPVFVALTREEGQAGRAAALPARLDPAGISAVSRPALSTRDRVRLDVALG